SSAPGGTDGRCSGMWAAQALASASSDEDSAAPRRQRRRGFGMRRSSPARLPGVKRETATAACPRKGCADERLACALLSSAAIGRPRSRRGGLMRASRPLARAPGIACALLLATLSPGCAHDEGIQPGELLQGDEDASARVAGVRVRVYGDAALALPDSAVDDV